MRLITITFVAWIYCANAYAQTYPLNGEYRGSILTESIRYGLLDSDGDGVHDGIDAFPFDPTEHSDFDHDGIGDNADADDDNDGVPDAVDPQPYHIGTGTILIWGSGNWARGDWK